MFRLVFLQLGVPLQQILPVALHIVHTKVIPDEVPTPEEQKMARFINIKQHRVNLNGNNTKANYAGKVNKQMIFFHTATH